jgi:type II restriction enzyme
MIDRFPKSTKSKKTKLLLNEALDILDSVGIPTQGTTPRRLERMAVCFLAVAGISKKWTEAKDATNLKSRDIIRIVNEKFEENISSGSYDDIRREDLKFPVIAGIVINSGTGKGSATNDPTRGYALNPEFTILVKSYGTDEWNDNLKKFKRKHKNLAELLLRKRDLEKIPVVLPSGKKLKLSIGKHNDLQKAIVEEFLPRFGGGSTVLYVGDTTDKFLHMEKDELAKLGFFELSHQELPDVVAYSSKHNWLYLIEAVYSSGPMSETRVLELKKSLKDCSAELIFVTAFLTREAFRKWQMDIAWETEVWIADNPDHMIHFNGHKFLGPF